MRLSEIGDKEIVDIVKGSMHGKLWDAEMLFDEATGAISFLLVPYFNGSGHKFSWWAPCSSPSSRMPTA